MKTLKLSKETIKTLRARSGIQTGIVIGPTGVGCGPSLLCVATQKGCGGTLTVLCARG
jgi:hypothetical protein